MKTLYVIKNLKYDNYYSSHIIAKQYHFVKDIRDAKYYSSKRDAQKMLKNFKEEDFEIVGVEKYE